MAQLFTTSAVELNLFLSPDLRQMAHEILNIMNFNGASFAGRRFPAGSQFSI